MSRSQGIPNSVPKIDYAPEEIAKIRSMAAKGMTIREITSASRRGEKSIEYIARKEKIKITKGEKSKQPHHGEGDFYSEHDLSQYPSDRNNIVAYPNGPFGAYRGK